MTIVVLGAGGKLGQLLRPVFPDEAAWLTRTEVDIYDPDALHHALTGATAVLCLAGVTNTRPQPMAQNTDLALRTLDAAEQAGAGRVLLFSSAAVYGRQPDSDQPLHEGSPTTPLSPYGSAKLAMEQVARAHAHPNTTLRLGNVAGADAILANWAPGFTLDTLPDGTTPKRSYIGPIALARILADLCRMPALPSLMNVAAPGSVEMSVLLDAAHLPWQPRPATTDTIAQVTLDTQILSRFTECPPSSGTATGIVADWRERQQYDVAQTHP